MRYGAPAVERAMKMQEIVLRAISGQLTWLQAADILGLSPRTVRRWRARDERQGGGGPLGRGGGGGGAPPRGGGAGPPAGAAGPPWFCRGVGFIVLGVPSSRLVAAPASRRRAQRAPDADC